MNHLPLIALALAVSLALFYLFRDLQAVKQGLADTAAVVASAASARSRPAPPRIDYPERKRAATAAELPADEAQAEPADDEQPVEDVSPPAAAAAKASELTQRAKRRGA